MVPGQQPLQEEHLYFATTATPDGWCSLPASVSEHRADRFKHQLSPSLLDIVRDATPPSSSDHTNRSTNTDHLDDSTCDDEVQHQSIRCAGEPKAVYWQSLTKDALRKVFNLPRSDAALRLGSISTANLKKACCKHGIKRWPYRKLSSLQHIMDDLRVDARFTEEQKQDLITKIKAEMLLLVENPNRKLNPQLDGLRLQGYKKKYLKKKAWRGKTSGCQVEEPVDARRSKARRSLSSDTTEGTSTSSMAAMGCGATLSPLSLPLPHSWLTRQGYTADSLPASCDTPPALLNNPNWTMAPAVEDSLMMNTFGGPMHSRRSFSQPFPCISMSFNLAACATETRGPAARGNPMHLSSISTPLPCLPTSSHSQGPMITLPRLTSPGPSMRVLAPTPITAHTSNAHMAVASVANTTHTTTHTTTSHQAPSTTPAPVMSQLMKPWDRPLGMGLPFSLTPQVNALHRLDISDPVSTNHQLDAIGEGCFDALLNSEDIVIGEASDPSIVDTPRFMDFMDCWLASQAAASPELIPVKPEPVETTTGPLSFTGATATGTMAAAQQLPSSHGCHIESEQAAAAGRTGVIGRTSSHGSSSSLWVPSGLRSDCYPLQHDTKLQPGLLVVPGRAGSYSPAGSMAYPAGSCSCPQFSVPAAQGCAAMPGHPVCSFSADQVMVPRMKAEGGMPFGESAVEVLEVLEGWSFPSSCNTTAEPVNASAPCWHHTTSQPSAGAAAGGAGAGAVKQEEYGQLALGLSGVAELEPWNGWSGMCGGQFRWCDADEGTLWQDGMAMLEDSYAEIDFML